MLQTAADVYDRMRTRIGKLARRFEDPLATPSERDEDALLQYLKDGLVEICKRTDRLTTSITITTTANQGWVERPVYVDRIEEAAAGDGTSNWVLEKQDGPEIAQWTRDPAAKEGKPTHLGAHDQRLYLHPVPDKEYDLDLQISYNGVVGDSAPSGVQDPPTVDTMIDRLPPDFEKGITSYVLGRWFEDTGSPEAARRELTRLSRQIQDFDDEPVKESTSSIKYNVLS